MTEVSSRTESDLVLVGYFRFIESDRPGVIGEVVSQYKEGFAEDSTVPVYRIPGETKGPPEAPQRPPGSFVCPRCGMVSHHPHDIAEGYCGACHDWTGKP